MRWGAIWVALIVSGIWAGESPTEMGDLAARMKPGEWAELKTQGLTAELTQITQNKYWAFGWTDDGAWDPQSRQFLLTGYRHYFKFIAYDEKTNAWRAEKPPTDEQFQFGHVYGNNAIDPATGDYFHHRSGSLQVYKYSTSAKQWSVLPEIKGAGVLHGTAIEYFPEMGGLVRLNPEASTLHFFDAKKSTWSLLAKSVPVGSCICMMKYNPVHKAILIAGGNRAFRNMVKLDRDGKVTALKQAPVDLKDNGCVVVADPVSGAFLVLAGAENKTYDMAKDEWSALALPAVQPPLNSAACLAAPVSTHGVIMFVDAPHNAAGRVFLYKHVAPTKPAR